jgi:putative transposase
VRHWTARTGLTQKAFVLWLGIQPSKFHDWCQRYGRVNAHNGSIPRDFWLEEWEREAIVDFHHEFPLEGYRRLTFMMLDRDVVAVSPSTTYRVLSAAGLIGRRPKSTSGKGKGFVQPERPHEHWHIDIAYLNICGTFYYICSILDGYSRSIVHWEIQESMTEAQVELVVQRACERFPQARPRIISDNGPQFIARDFKHFIREAGLEHVRTAPYYPQSNGKKERYWQTVKSEAIRPGSPLTIEDARRIVRRFVEHYDNVRLHSAIGYITPADRLAGRTDEIHAARDRKLEAARARRAEARRTAA